MSSEIIIIEKTRPTLLTLIGKETKKIAGTLQINAVTVIKAFEMIKFFAIFCESIPNFRENK